MIMKPSRLKKVLVWTMVLLFMQSCGQDNPLDDILGADGSSSGNVSDATAQVIVDWNDLWLVTDRYSTGMRPNATARALAYIHLAAYETAVHSMDGYTSMERRLNGFNINENQRDDGIHVGIALNSCYAATMEHFMYGVTIDAASRINELRSTRESNLGENLSNDVVRESREWGEYVAERVIAYSQSDRDAEEQILEPQPRSYEPPTGDGYWTYSDDAERALFPYWSSVRTFVISSRQTSSVPPRDRYSENNSSGYFAQMAEVYEVSTTAREADNEQLWIAEFWSDDVEELMVSPPGRQVSIANQLVVQHDLDLASTLALYLKLGFSLNDAAVSTWADKYEYMVMRPTVYVHEFIDPNFQTNLYRFINWPNPSFPGYPSGHSAFASAAAGVFISQFGDNTNFTDLTHEGRTEFRGAARQYNRLSDMAEENAFSRIPLGVHIRMDCEEGLRLGYEVADAVNRFLSPNS